MRWWVCTQGLKEFPSIVIVPMMQISWTLFSILSGGIYFKEYRTFTAGSGFMFTLGVLVGALHWSAKLQVNVCSRVVGVM